MTRALLLLSLSACAGGFQVEAKVSRGESPVAGATVAMDCPQLIKASAPSVLGTTDASGVLTMHEPMFGRWIHDGCVLIVTKDGYEEKRFPVESVCRAYETNHCTRAVLAADLTPR